MLDHYAKTGNSKLKLKTIIVLLRASGSYPEGGKQ